MNRPKVFALAAIAATAIFSVNQASASMGAVNISGTIALELDNVTNTSETMITKTVSFKNSDALALLANATGNSWFTNRGSQLVYDPDVYNAEASAWYSNDVYGIFWVTNTITKDYFQLDGPSEFGYFSYVELDFAPWTLGTSAAGFLNDNGIFTGKYVVSPYQYSSKILGNATFYIHDNPYAFDYPDNLGTVVFNNDFAVVITGTMTYNFSYRPYSSIPNYYSSRNSFSLKGSGDVFWDNSPYVDAGYSVTGVFNGSVSHTDSGIEEMNSPLIPASF